MRGSIVCIAIFFLSYVNGYTPVGETFDYKDTIHSLDTFWRDEIIYAACKESDGVKKCTVYATSSEPSPHNSGNCDLNLTFSGSFDDGVGLYNAGHSRAIFALKDGDDEIKLFSVNITECEVSEASLKVKKVDSLSDMLVIVPLENNYDVILRNSKDCIDGLCKSTYDYDGNLVKASRIPAVVDGFNIVKYAAAQDAYVFAKPEGRFVKVYLVKDGDDNNNISPVVTIESTSGVMSLSAEENKIAICSFGEGKVICKQIHVDDKSRIINTEIPYNLQKDLFHHLDVINLEKGLLLLSIDAESFVKVTHFDEEGKHVKSVEYNPTCDAYYLLPSILYKNAKGRYCVNSFCMSTFGPSVRSKLLAYNQCFDNSELF